MITRLEIQNFKSWQRTGPIRLAPITALFGSNSSGKTSLLQSILMLKQTADSPDRTQVLNLGDDRSPVELGTFPEILFDHDLKRTLTWSVEWTLPQTLKIADPARKSARLFEGDSLGFVAEIGWGAGTKKAAALRRPTVHRMEYRFNNREFRMALKSQDTAGYELSAHPRFEFVRARGRAWALPPPLKCYGFPDQVRAYYQNAGFLSEFELEFEKLLTHVYYLGPLREYPRRQYEWAGAQPADMGRQGERVVHALLSARESGMTIARGRGRGRTRLSLEARVALWLQELGMISSFGVRRIARGSTLFKVWVKRTPSSPEVLLTDVGFGVSQILPVITLCYYAPEGSTLLLEQPEIHLHPRVQAGLADVFIDATKSRKIQIILESHSEHLLRRLQRRVAEEGLLPEDTALYFCSLKERESRLEPLKLNEFGNIENWPEDFFGDEYGEIAAMSEAALKRRRRHSA